MKKYKLGEMFSFTRSFVSERPFTMESVISVCALMVFKIFYRLLLKRIKYS
jgi:hypothetical protein